MEKAAMFYLSMRERLNQPMLLDQAERVAIGAIRQDLIRQLRIERDKFSYFGLYSALRALDLIVPVTEAGGNVCIHTTMAFTHGIRFRNPGSGAETAELPELIKIAAKGNYPLVSSTSINLWEFTPRKLAAAVSRSQRAWFIVTPDPSPHDPPAHIIGARIDRRYPKMQIWDTQADVLYYERTGESPLFTILDMNGLHSRLRRFHHNKKYPIRVVAF